MTAFDTDLISQLEARATEFASRQGSVAVLIQSKSEPDIAAAINGSMQMPSASVVKAAIACAAAHEAAQGRLDLSEMIDVGALDKTFYCSILHAFEPADQLTLKNLIGLMLIVSDNPATTAVLNAIGMDKVNHWLQTQGLNDTDLQIGFDDASLGAPLRANMTTADDCIALLRLIDTDENYAFVKNMLANNLRNQRIPKRLPDDAVIAHKTGTLKGLVHDIAIIDSPSAAYYLVVLGDGLEDEAAFAEDLSAFSRDIYDLMPV